MKGADGKRGRVMTLEQNITAVLETCFAGFKDELINEAVKSILRLFDNQVGPPAFSTNPCESCEHATSIAGEAECYNCCGYYANNYKAKSTGSPIGDYRDGVGAWQTERMTEEEIDTMLAKALVGQTDCGWGKPNE